MGQKANGRCCTDEFLNPPDGPCVLLAALPAGHERPDLPDGGGDCILAGHGGTEHFRTVANAVSIRKRDHLFERSTVPFARTDAWRCKSNRPKSRCPERLSCTKRPSVARVGAADRPSLNAVRRRAPNLPGKMGCPYRHFWQVNQEKAEDDDAENEEDRGSSVYDFRR